MLIVLTSTTSGCMWDEWNVLGADGHRIELVNNPDARKPSWEQLKNFLQKDLTDRIEYDEDSFVCADYAEMLHNSAEEAGWRAAFVIVELGPGSRGVTTERMSSYDSQRQSAEAAEVLGDPDPVGILHALNAFETADLGLVYIDSTGLPKGVKGPTTMDRKVDIEIGGDYIPEQIFPEPGWLPVYGNMGKIEWIEVRW